ncbi:MAG: LacI family DNA-binding transcriptional regulator [Elusimicrobiota bacterium]
MNLAKIAKKLGVSRWTVSRALYSSGYVDKKKKEKILTYLKKIDYTPNIHASSLGGKRSRVIGLILPKGVVSGFDFFLAETIKHLALGLKNSGYSLMLFIDKEGDDAGIAKLWENRTIAGAVMFSSTKDDVGKLRELIKCRMPSVLVFSHFKGIDSFACDNEYGGYLATKYLIEKGRRRIAFIHGNPAWVDSADRFKGYLRALAEHGIVCDSVLVKEGYFNVPEGKKAAEKLIGLEKRPDAIFASNDNMAIGAAWAIGEKQLRIPGDIAVIGFDNNADAKNTNPPLTTIAQPIKEIIDASMERLIAKIEGRETGKPVLRLFPPKLIERGSV